MDRRELEKKSYEILRTQIDIPGSKYCWEVATIDLKKFYDQSSALFDSLELEGYERAPFPFETVVYRKPKSLSAKHAEKIKKKRNRVYFMQFYQNIPEAQFGHEELVQSVLTGQFFTIESLPMIDGMLQDYLHKSDQGELVDDYLPDESHYIPQRFFEVLHALHEEGCEGIEGLQAADFREDPIEECEEEADDFGKIIYH